MNGTAYGTVTKIMKHHEPSSWAIMIREKSESRIAGFLGSPEGVSFAAVGRSSLLSFLYIFVVMIEFDGIPGVLKYYPTNSACNLRLLNCPLPLATNRLETRWQGVVVMSVSMNWGLPSWISRLVGQGYQGWPTTIGPLMHHISAMCSNTMDTSTCFTACFRVHMMPRVAYSFMTNGASPAGPFASHSLSSWRFQPVAAPGGQRITGADQGLAFEEIQRYHKQQ